MLPRILKIAAAMLALELSNAMAGLGARDFELSDGSNSNSASTELTYRLTDYQEIDLSQDIRVDDLAGTDNRWKGATRGDYNFNYYDFKLSSSKLRPYVGANANYVYGNRVNDSLLVGPDAGLKIEVQPKMVVVAQAEYQSSIRDVDQLDESVGDGSIAYSLGLRLQF